MQTQLLSDGVDGPAKSLPEETSAHDPVSPVPLETLRPRSSARSSKSREDDEVSYALPGSAAAPSGGAFCQFGSRSIASASAAPCAAVNAPSSAPPAIPAALASDCAYEFGSYPGGACRAI